MLFTTMAAVGAEAFAAVPATSITKLTPFKKQIKVFVKKNSKVSGYQVKYAANKQFKNAKTKTLKGANKTMLRLIKLGNKKTYYFKVRTYKQKGKKKTYSKWSKVKSAKTNARMDERYLALIDEVYQAAKYGYAPTEEEAKKVLSKNAYTFFTAWNSYSSRSVDGYDDLKYTFVDLDSNGIDELVLGDQYTIYGIFTISGGKLTFVYGRFGRMHIIIYGKTVYTYCHGGYQNWWEEFDVLPKNTAKLKVKKYFVYAEGHYYVGDKEVPASTYENYFANVKKGAEPKYKYVKDLLAAAKANVADVTGAQCHFGSAFEHMAILMDYKKVSGATGYQYKTTTSTGTKYDFLKGAGKTKVMVYDSTGGDIYVRAYKKTSKGTVYSKNWTKLYTDGKQYSYNNKINSFDDVTKAGYVELNGLY